MHELPWLLKPPTDFNQRCAQLADLPSCTQEVLTLANSALSINQSNRLLDTLTRLNTNTRAQIFKDLTPFKLGVVSNATTDLFVPSMVMAALRCGVNLEVVVADFGQVAQEAFDPNSRLNQSGLNAILLSWDYRAYPFPINRSEIPIAKLTGNDMLDFLRHIRDAFAVHSGAICITQTLACPPYEWSGNFDAQHEGMLRKSIAEFNIALAENVKASADVILDVATIANTVGTYQWFDERQWYMSRVPMANRYIPLYADYLAKLVAALRGKSKKCLVLDLDNTLWGGVIGDDGLDGIQIGQGHPVGESFLAIQQWVYELKELGVILAVCSKNEEDVALQVFREHPGMLLKEDDFALFVANWEDKASNVRFIADTLNIGLDALVFMDDNPAEREIVRTLVPEVSVPELPKDPSRILRTISAARYFEKIEFTEDDAKRNVQYADNVKRKKMQATSSDLIDYLISLDMDIRFAPFNEMGRKRILQLVNKTNQFNLTTQRYTEAELLQFEKASDGATLQIHLQDRFGDNGMISVVICNEKKDCWEIDTWLMSCRVIKRRVEEIVCDELVMLARSHNIRLLRGFYRPTARNKLVQSHYQLMGFQLVNANETHEIWELFVDAYIPKNPPIRVNRPSCKSSI